MNTELSILFLGKAEDVHCARALTFLQSVGAKVMVCQSRRGTSFPGDLSQNRFDYVVSYLCQWILPPGLLRCAARAAINFHPAPPEYPGTGCINFALYEDAPYYGVTCHHMVDRVDSGSIIVARRFPVFPHDDVASLLARTYDHQLALFYDVMGGVFAGDTLPRASERWSERKRTRRDLDALARLTSDMTREEVARRVRATSFDQWQPYIEVQGFRFRLDRQTTATLLPT